VNPGKHVQLVVFAAVSVHVESEPHTVEEQELIGEQPEDPTVAFPWKPLKQLQEKEPIVFIHEVLGGQGLARHSLISTQYV